MRRRHAWGLLPVAMLLGCVGSHAASLPGRPALACVYPGGLIHYGLAQTTEDGDHCVVLSFTQRGDASAFSVESDHLSIDGPAGYAFEHVLRYAGPCDLLRPLAVDRSITSADHVTGTVDIERAADPGAPGRSFLSATLDLSFPASPDGTIGPTSARMHAVSVDTGSRSICLDYDD